MGASRLSGRASRPQQVLNVSLLGSSMEFHKIEQNAYIDTRMGAEGGLVVLRWAVWPAAIKPL